MRKQRRTGSRCALLAVLVLAVFPPGSGCGGNPALLSADFVSGPDSFVYLDDAFRGTARPDYASGVYAAGQGYANGALQVTLGGVDDVDVFGMSGGWERSFSSPAADLVTISLRYRLVLSAGYETDECSQPVVTVDGDEDYLPEVCGGGGVVRDTGWLQVSWQVPVAAGPHVLRLGVWANQKTEPTEITDIYFDEVRIRRTHGPTPLAIYDFTSGSVGFSFVDEGNPSAWGASEGYLQQTNQGADGFDGSFFKGSWAWRPDSLSLSDYRLRVRLVPRDTPDGGARDVVGVVFRYQDDDNHYRFLLSRKQGLRRLEKRLLGVASNLVFDGRGFADDVALDLVVDVIGPRVVLSVNGERVFGVEDGDLASGSFGLYAQGPVDFDYAVVLPAPTAAAVVAAPPSVTVPVPRLAGPPFALPVSALAQNAPAGSTVRFLLDANTPAELSLTASSEPFQGVFPSVAPGWHTLTTVLSGGSGQLLDFEKKQALGVGGLSLLAFGDSVTAGEDDDAPLDDVSANGVNHQRGYAPILNDLVSATSGLPVAVFNEGFGGGQAPTGAVRVAETRVRHPNAEIWLVLFGTNDSTAPALASGVACTEADFVASRPSCLGTYKDFMRQIVLDLQAGGVEPVLGKVPFVPGAPFVRDQAIQEYNAVIDQLVTQHGLAAMPPDFYAYFQANPGELGSPNHPNGMGYASMATLWHQALLDAGLLD